MSGSPTQHIFLSYRRDDAGPYPHVLRQELSRRLQGAVVFMDQASIKPGQDFAKIILDEIKRCSVLVALIGPQRASVTDRAGRRRLDNEDDYVRLEIQAALDRGVWVIPVLIDKAEPLRRQELPVKLHKLAKLSAARLRYDEYDTDVGRLADLIQRLLDEPGSTGTDDEPQQSLPGQAARRDQEAINDSARVLVDPERFAISLTDTADRAYVLFRISTALAATKPNRAARLLADAERTAWFILDQSSRAGVLTSIATAVATADPDRAERRARDIQDESSRDDALASIATALATTDPDRAERIARDIQDESSRAGVLTNIVVAALATTAPYRAERRARDIQDESSRNDAFTSIATAVATSHPAYAVRIARSITVDRSRALALASIAALVAPTDPDRAARIIADAENIARSFSSSEGITTHLLTGIATRLATACPDQAERIARDIPDARSRAGVLTSTATARATNPDRAERAAQSITGGFWIGGPASTATAVAATDPGRAVRIANDIHDESSRNHELAIIATTVAVTDPDRAEGIAQHLITNKGLQIRTLASIAMALVATDLDRAVRIIIEVEQDVQSLRSSAWGRDTLVMIAEAEVLIAEQRPRASDKHVTDS